MITACAGSEDESRGCLGSSCGDALDVLTGGGDVQIPSEGTGTSDGTNIDNGSGNDSFRCTSVPNMVILNHKETMSLDIQAFGGRAPYRLDEDLGVSTNPFSGRTQRLGSYNNSGNTNLIIERTVRVFDARNDYAECDFTVTVLPENGSSSDLACEISVDKSNPNPGEVVNFTFSATGGDGSYTFLDFKPMVDYTASVERESDTQSSSQFIYNNRAVRYAQVSVVSDNNKSVCRRAIFVGTQLPSGWDPNWDWRTLPPWWNTYFPPVWPIAPIDPTPVGGCNISASPNPGITGTLTRVNVTPQDMGSRDDLEVTYNTSMINGATVVDTDLEVAPEDALLQRVIRYRRPGQYQIRATVRNLLTGRQRTCTTLYSSRIADGYATSPDRDIAPEVKLYRGSLLLRRFTEFNGNQDTGVRIAVADVNGDGKSDIITGAGPGGNHRVIVRDGNNLSRILFDFDAFPSHGGNGGVFVAAGDINGDGKADIITGQDNGAWIKVYDGASTTLVPTRLAGLRPYYDLNVNYASGIRVAVADMNGDGFSDILVAPGPHGRTPVRYYDGQVVPTWTKLGELDPFMANNPNGIFIAAGDVTGDGKADIVVAHGDKTEASWYNRSVKLFDCASGCTMVTEFEPYSDLDDGNGVYDKGTRVALADLNGDGRMDLVTAPGTDVAPRIRAFHSLGVAGLSSSRVLNFNAYSSTYEKGIFVGGGTGGL